MRGVFSRVYTSTGVHLRGVSVVDPRGGLSPAYAHHPGVHLRGLQFGGFLRGVNLQWIFSAHPRSRLISPMYAIEKQTSDRRASLLNIQWRQRVSNIGGRPSPSLLPSPPLPTLPPPLPSPSLPLEVGPLNPARGSRGAVSSLSGVWGRAPVEIEFGAF